MVEDTSAQRLRKPLTCMQKKTQLPALKISNFNEYLLLYPTLDAVVLQVENQSLMKIKGWRESSEVAF